MATACLKLWTLSLQNWRRPFSVYLGGRWQCHFLGGTIAPTFPWKEERAHAKQRSELGVGRLPSTDLLFHRGLCRWCPFASCSVLRGTECGKGSQTGDAASDVCAAQGLAATEA